MSFRKAAFCLNSNTRAVSDATVLLRDVAGDAAQKAATKVNPTDDQLSQIDQPAEDNTWHDPVKMSDLKAQAQSRSPFASKEEAKQEAKGALGDATQAAHPQGSRDPADAAQARAEAERQGTTSGVSGTDAKEGAKQSVKDRFGGRFDENQKQKMREYRERSNNYFKDKVPKERRDQVVFRLKKMIVEIQNHQDCKLELTH